MPNCWLPVWRARLASSTWPALFPASRGVTPLFSPGLFDFILCAQRTARVSAYMAIFEIDCNSTQRGTKQYTHPQT